MATSSFLRRSDLFWLALVSLMLLLQFWWLPGTGTTPDDTYSNSVDGKLGFYRIMESVFPNVQRDRDQLIPESKCVLVMVAPDRYPNKREQIQLRDFVSDGGVLIFAPSWKDRKFESETLEFSLRTRNKDGGHSPVVQNENTTSIEPNGETNTGEANTDEANTDTEETNSEGGTNTSGENNNDDDEEVIYISEIDKARRIISDLTNSEFDVRSRSRFEYMPDNRDDLAVVDPADMDNPILDDEEIFAASWYYGDGVIAVCTSPDVFSNLSMLDPARALFAVRLVEHCFEKSPMDSRFDTVSVSEFYNVASNYRYSGILFAPALRNGTLQLITIGLLFAWFSYHRFGPALRVSDNQRRSLKDSAAAVGNLLYRCEDGGSAVGSYLEYVKSRFRREYGQSGSLDNVELLAARSGLPVEEIKTELQLARTTAATPDVSRSDAAARIRWLTKLMSGTAKEKPIDNDGAADTK